MTPHETTEMVGRYLGMVSLGETEPDVAVEEAALLLGPLTVEHGKAAIRHAAREDRWFSIAGLSAAIAKTQPYTPPRMRLPGADVGAQRAGRLPPPPGENPARPGETMADYFGRRNAMGHGGNFTVAIEAALRGRARR